MHPDVEKKLQSLPNDVESRIRSKLAEAEENPDRYLKLFRGRGEHSVRIGKRRALVDWKTQRGESGFWRSIREKLSTSSCHRERFRRRPSDPDSQQSIEGTCSVSCDLLVMLPKTELNRIDEDVIETYYPEDGAEAVEAE